jgi:hypothetical protein
MADYVTLLGAEEVSRAGGSMREAAQTMSNAASSMAFAIEQQQRFMDDWLQRLDHVLSNRMGPMA